MAPARPTVRPAVLLLMVAALIVALRVIEATGGPRNAIAEVPPWLLALSAGASLAVAVATRRRVNRILAVLVAAAVGGLILARYNAMPGVALGTAVGSLVAWAVVRRVALAALTVCSVAMAGVVAGGTVLSLTGNPGDGFHAAIVAPMSALAGVAGILLVWHAWRGRPSRWPRVLGHTALLLAFVVGQWLSLSADTLRRVWWLGTDYRLCLIQRGEKWLYRGFVGVRSFVGGQRVGDQALVTIGGWKELDTLDLSGADITDAGLAEIGRLSRLWVLILNDTPITGDGLRNLAGLRRLYQIELQGTQLTDDRLRHLKAWPGIQGLRLDHTQITNDGLEELQALSRLVVLGLSGTRIGGDGLGFLDAAPGVRDLELADTEVTDADLATLFTQPRPLNSLDLSGTRITDLGVEHLVEATWLGKTWLKLARTRITDEGLRHLAEMKNLYRLDVSGTQVTDTGLAYLRSLDNLTLLQVGGTRVSAAGLAQLEGMTGIERIDVPGTDVVADDLPMLRRKLPLTRIMIEAH